VEGRIKRLDFAQHDGIVRDLEGHQITRGSPERLPSRLRNGDLPFDDIRLYIPTSFTILRVKVHVRLETVKEGSAAVPRQRGNQPRQTPHVPLT
jgi:hypothetical protein